MNQPEMSLWVRGPEAQIPLSRALDLFDAAYRASGKSVRTIAWYRQRLGYVFAHLANDLGREPTIADFTPQSFRLFMLGCRARGKYHQHPFKAPSTDPLSSAYLHAFYRAVRGFSSWLYRERLIPLNVMLDVDASKLEQRELQPLTEDEELRLLNSYAESKPLECRDKAVLMLMLATGLRKGEVIDLPHDAVNLEEGFVTVWGKGRKQRSVPFGYKTGWLLQRYNLLHRTVPAMPTCKSFFLTRDGYAFSVATIDMIFARARRKTGIKRLHAHLLRHTYGTRSAEMGIPTLTLQRFMGHSQPSVTERYSHLAQSERLKRERSYDHLDGMDLRVKRPRIR